MSATPAMNGSFMTRRRMLGVTGAAALAMPLAACGSGAPESETESGGKKGGAFIAYWNAAHEYEAYKDVIKEFEKKHGVSVEVQKYQWEDMRTRLITDLQSGNVPDVVEEPGSWVQEFGLSGDALSLDDYIAKDGEAMGFPDDWLDVAVADNTHDGSVYGIQLHYTCSLLFYNTKMFEDAGLEPPTTWDELLSVAQELTTDKVHGIALNPFQDYSWPWMLQNGVREYDPATKELLTPRPAAIEAMRFQADLVHKHKVSPKPTVSKDPTGPQKLFSAGRAAMMVSGPWDMPAIAQSSPDLKYGVAPAPKGKKQATIAAGTSVFIPKKASRPDLSWDFIKRITALKTELAATEEAGMLMPRKSWAEDETVQGDPKIKTFADGLTYAEEFRADVYTTGKSGELADLYKKLYESIMVQGTDVEKAFSTYQSAAQKLVKG